MNETVVNNAMQIILHAGDARVFCKQALDAIASNDFESANEKLKQAQSKITEAHKVQTDAIQEETRGVDSEYSLLFAHAQDTLMTIYSEINIAKQLLKIFKVYNDRLEKLEKE
jgi:Phosphotransferase system cellobiose-specific component IIA